MSPSIRLQAVAAIAGKELRQVRRSRSALLSAILLPALLMLFLPFTATSFPPTGGAPGLTGPGSAQGASFSKASFTIPLFIAMAGILAPSVTAMHMIIAEREQRSVELLVALPVRVADILAGKLVAVLVTSSASLLPFFAFDAAVLLANHLASPGYLALLLFVLLAAIASSIGMSFFLALMAGDSRTSRNVSGLLLLPDVILTGVVLGAVPGVAKLVALGLVLLAIGVIAVLVALHWLTFERFLE
ncbi:MAG: ABC transporter permease [Candidatus Dormibacteraceae bacterium]